MNKQAMVAFLLSIFAITVSSFSLGYSYGHRAAGCFGSFIQFNAEPDADRCVVWQGCEEVDVEVLV